MNGGPWHGAPARGHQRWLNAPGRFSAHVCSYQDPMVYYECEYFDCYPGPFG
jgi:hypothetical protein